MTRAKNLQKNICIAEDNAKFSEKILTTPPQKTEPSLVHSVVVLYIPLVKPQQCAYK